MTPFSSIPRIIHYCWFGHGEMPALAKRCIDSWHTHLHGYQIMAWDEDTFDITSHQYVREAYQEKKYAFVSDYVRLHALYQHGGIYLDTDVEVLQPLDKFLGHASFWGFEEKNYVATSIIGARERHPLIREFLNHYQQRQFIMADGSCDLTTNVAVITDICRRHGLMMDGEYQELDNGVAIYPRTYFSPYDYINCVRHLTRDSYALHHYDQSWLATTAKMKGTIKRLLARAIGGQRIAQLRQLMQSK